jgi:hypothetical protein
MLGISLSELCKGVSKKWRKVSRIVKRFGKYRRKVSWNVKPAIWKEYWAMFSSYQKQALTVMISPLCTNCHDITVILLNVALNTTNLIFYLQRHIPTYLLALGRKIDIFKLIYRYLLAFGRWIYTKTLFRK